MGSTSGLASNFEPKAKWVVLPSKAASGTPRGGPSAGAFCVDSSPVQDATLRGRSAYEQRAWGDAYDALFEASAAGPLAADDVERLAWSAMLAGRDESA